MKRMLVLLVMLVYTPIIAACSQENSGNTGPSYEDRENIESWVGKWTGPEGTYMTIAPNDDTQGFSVTIANLDGPRTFFGNMTKEGIAFQRDGVREIITTGSGADTGMKWLADKEDCLVIKAGEGYCR